MAIHVIPSTSELFIFMILDAYSMASSLYRINVTASYDAQCVHVVYHHSFYHAIRNERTCCVISALYVNMR